MLDQPHFAAMHHVVKDITENSPIFFHHDDSSEQFLPLALSQLTTGSLLNMENKPARNLQVPAKGQDLARDWHRILLYSVGRRGRISSR